MFRCIYAPRAINKILLEIPENFPKGKSCMFLGREHLLIVIRGSYPVSIYHLFRGAILGSPPPLSPTYLKKNITIIIKCLRRRITAKAIEKEITENP